MKNNSRTAGILTIISGGLGVIGFGFGLNFLFFGWFINFIAASFGYHPQDTAAGLIYSLLAFPAGIVAIILGVYLLKKRIWWLGVAGVATSFVAFFPCGIAALVYLIKARLEFVESSPAPIPEGQSIAPSKRQRTAIILACFFGPFAWLYTYRRDALKAAIGLGMSLPPLILAAFAPIFFRNISTQIDAQPPSYIYFIPDIFIFIFVWLPIWFWAVVDMATVSDWNAIKPRPRNKTAAILLGVLLNPWTWFYTYKKDAPKFWLCIIFSYGIEILFFIWYSRVDINLTTRTYTQNWEFWVLEAVSSIISLTILITSVVITALRPKEWFDNYED